MTAAMVVAVATLALYGFLGWQRYDQARRRDRRDVHEIDASTLRMLASERQHEYDRDRELARWNRRPDESDDR